MLNEEYGFTMEENELLNRMAVLELDGMVGKEYSILGCVGAWTGIVNGIPTRFREGPTKKIFRGGEVIREPGELIVEKEWRTEEDKLAFLRGHGFMMTDEAVKRYASGNKHVFPSMIFCFRYS